MKIILFAICFVFGSSITSFAIDVNRFKYQNCPDEFVDIFLPKQSVSLTFGLDSANLSFFFVTDTSGRLIKFSDSKNYFELQPDFSWKKGDDIGLSYEFVLTKKEKIEVSGKFEVQPSKPNNFAVDLSPILSDIQNKTFLPLGINGCEARLYLSKESEANFIVTAKKEGAVDCEIIYLFRDNELFTRISFIKLNEKSDVFLNDKMGAVREQIDGMTAQTKDAGKAMSDHLKISSAFLDALPAELSTYFDLQKDLDRKVQSVAGNYRRTSAYFKWKYDQDLSVNGDKQFFDVGFKDLNSLDSKVRATALTKFGKVKNLADYKEDLCKYVPKSLVSEDRVEQFAALMIITHLQWEGVDSLTIFAPAIRKFLAKEDVSPIQVRILCNLVDFSKNKTPKVDDVDDSTWWKENMAMMKNYILESLPEETERLK